MILCLHFSPFPMVLIYAVTRLQTFQEGIGLYQKVSL